MKKQSDERGMALVTALGILALFLLVALLILTMTSQNSQNFGNAYQKQRYYNVAEAGIDRGLKDLDSGLPTPGSAGFLTGTPAPPPAPPTSNQTPLPNVPNVSYFYSYWFNSGTSPTSTPDPLAGSFGVSTTNTVKVPAKGAVIWSYTVTGSRDVAVETVVTRFAESTGTCAICAGQNVTVTGSQNFSPPPTVCGNPANPDKVCSDPNASPSPAPSSVPIVVGGSYTCSGAAAGAAPCAYGDGTSTPNPTQIQQNSSPGVVSGFLASQGTIDQLGNVNYWKNLASLSSNVKYIDCTSGCSSSTLQGVAPSAGQVTFVNGSINWSSKSTLSYGGLFIVSQCLSITQPGFSGTGVASETIVLGTDGQCGGAAASMSGGGNTKPPLWDGGTLYTAQGSASIAGNGSVRGYNFYGAIISAGSVTVSGNGFFAWESKQTQQVYDFGPFAIVSFAQY